MIPLMRHKEVHNWFSAILSSGLAPFLVGNVGCGKSQLAISYAQKRELMLHTIYLDSMYEMDIIGYASPNHQTGKFEYLPCDLFPLEGEPLPINPDTGREYKGHCILLEEFGNCPKSMQVAAQRIILDRSVGKHKLHPQSHIILLGNKVSSGANALPISAAIRTRCSIAELQTDSHESASDFVEYMKAAGFHNSIVRWIEQDTTVIRKQPRDLIEDGESPFLTNRGLEALSNMLNKLQIHADKTKVPFSSLMRDKLTTVQSIIGYSNGADFFTFTMVPTTGYEEILVSPDTAQVYSTTADALRVANFLISNVADKNHLDNTLTYLGRLDETTRISLANKLIMGSNVFANDSRFSNIIKYGA